MKILKSLILASVVVFLLQYCATEAKKEGEKKAPKEEAQPKVDEWISLFDGTTTAGWRAFNGDALPANWVIEEGLLKSLGSGGDIGGDIVYTTESFENFELTLEWKISEGGNSGVLYHVVEGDQYNALYETGPEYQLLDDIGYDGALKESQKVGSDYDMYAADASKEVRPANEWNSTRIIFTAENVQYWLNGKKVVEFVPWSDDWNERRNNSKWKDHADWGQAKSGLIGLQDHGSFIWFRDIKIKRL
jgi:hypothetical protein